jgi:O-antigen ligase
MYTIDFAHNDYLQYLAELGAIAFLIGLVLVLRLFTKTLRAAIHDPSTDRRYVSLACTGAFVAILLHSLVDFNLYIPANAMLLAWIAALAASSNPRGAGIRACRVAIRADGWRTGKHVALLGEPSCQP